MCGHQALGQIIWLLLREYPEAPRLGVSPPKTFFTNRAEILLPAPSSSGIDTFTFYPRQWKKCCFSIFSLCYGRWFLFKLVKRFLNTDCNHRLKERTDELSYLILKWSITCWLSWISIRKGQRQTCHSTTLTFFLKDVDAVNINQ